MCARADIMRAAQAPDRINARVRRGLEWAARADVAQLARASPCHGEGRGFESLHPLRAKPPHLLGFCRLWGWSGLCDATRG
jgi:hypothetical protein